MTNAEKVKDLESQLKNLGDTVTKLQKRVADNERVSRSRNIRIRGLPLKPNEDLEAMVRVVFKDGFKMSKSFLDKLLIDNLHRVGKKDPVGTTNPQPDRTVIIAFSQRTQMKAILANRKNLAGYKYDGQHKISVDVDLTKEMLGEKKKAMEVKKVLIEKFRKDKKMTKVQVVRHNMIKIGADPLLHYNNVKDIYKI